MSLDSLLKPYKLNRGKHDTLIRKITSNITISPNVLLMYQNAYFKAYGVEGDIDALFMHYNAKTYEIDDWREVQFNDSTLLLFEMKSNDTIKNYRKAKSQLIKEKSFITKHTNYQIVDCFYAFNVGNSHAFRFEQL